MPIPEERQFDLDDAQARVLREFEHLGLEPLMQVTGEGPCVVRVGVHDAQGRLLTVGWGKGEPAAARVGGLHEALEHFLATRTLTTGTSVQPVEDVLKQLELQGTSDLPGLLLADQIEESIACRRYQCLQSEATFDYPVILSAPQYLDTPLAGDTFDYTALRRYASNSGTAIGASREEAVLHALNECIERDALSQFLLIHFFHQRPVPLKLVDPETLPADASSLWQRAEAMVDAPITLLDISTRGVVTTCLAVAHTLYPYPRPFGAGASLNPALAARRAVSELVQAHLGAEMASDDARTTAAGLPLALANWPRLHASLQLDIEHCMDVHGTVPAALPERRCDDLHAQIQCIGHDLHAQGLQAGVSILHESDQGTCLANVVVPRFERYYLVTTGNVVVPGKRGQALAAA